MKGFCFTMFICCIICIVCISCTLKDLQDWNVQERLGDNYNIDVECKGLIYGDEINGGSIVIDQGIIDYAYDERWIIAKTKSVMDITRVSQTVCYQTALQIIG